MRYRRNKLCYCIDFVIEYERLLGILYIITCIWVVILLLNNYLTKLISIFVNDYIIQIIKILNKIMVSKMRGIVLGISSLVFLIF